MFHRTFQFLLAAILATTALWAADDPFAGDWKLNPSRSTFIDVMKVESLGANRYAFDLGGGNIETITIDGTDQPGVQGTTLAVIVEAPDNWKVVRKRDGHTLLTGAWKLSADGKTLTDNYTQFAENGPASTVKYLYNRTAARAGFAGRWEAAMPIESAVTLQLRSFEGKGLSFIRSADDQRNLKLDGKEYPATGRQIAAGSTCSARRVSERALEITEKVKGSVERTEKIELSLDLKTLTRTLHPVGQSEPNVYVFERQ